MNSHGSSRAIRIIAVVIRFRSVLVDVAPGDSEALFMAEFLVGEWHSEAAGGGAFVFRGVAHPRRPGAEVDLRGLQLDLDVVVAEHVAQDAVGLVPGLAQHGVVGVAHQPLPARFVGLGPAAQIADVELEFERGDLPTAAVGAQFGGLEQGVVEDIALGGDHGRTLMVCESAYMCTIGYALPNRDVK